jgi:hypothetical protein
MLLVTLEPHPRGRIRVIDRWLLVVQEWFQTLEDLKEATESFNSAGIPIAMEGPQALAPPISSTRAMLQAMPLRRSTRSMA